MEAAEPPTPSSTIHRKLHPSSREGDTDPSTGWGQCRGRVEKRASESKDSASHLWKHVICCMPLFGWGPTPRRIVSRRKPAATPAPRPQMSRGHSRPHLCLWAQWLLYLWVSNRLPAPGQMPAPFLVLPVDSQQPLLPGSLPRLPQTVLGVSRALPQAP